MFKGACQKNVHIDTSPVRRRSRRCVITDDFVCLHFWPSASAHQRRDVIWVWYDWLHSFLETRPVKPESITICTDLSVVRRAKNGSLPSSQENTFVPPCFWRQQHAFKRCGSHPKCQAQEMLLFALCCAIRKFYFLFRPHWLLGQQVHLCSFTLRTHQVAVPHSLSSALEATRQITCISKVIKSHRPLRTCSDVCCCQVHWHKSILQAIGA